MTKPADPKSDEQKLDDTVEDSFPASDPPSYSAVSHVGKHHEENETTSKDSAQRNQGERPTGYPTSDRHATETAYHWENEQKPSLP